MPSPVGHALGGIACGVLISRRGGWRLFVWFALAGALADLDLLLPLQHRGPSHSIAMAVLMLAVAYVVGRTLRRDGMGPTPGAVALGIGSAYVSHVLLDWLGSDTASPRGVMAFWPFSHAFHISGLDLFDRIERRYWRPDFWERNAIALLREIVILGPVTWLAQRIGGTGRPGSGTHAA